MSKTSVVAPVFDASIDVIRRHQSPTGAYIAAPGYGTYAYSWIRDGAFIASAMDAHGHSDSAEAFHLWVASAVDRYRYKIDRIVDRSLGADDEASLEPLTDDSGLHTRFTVDGEEGQGHWGNFQLDGYGFWLTSVVEHIRMTGCNPAPYRNAIDLVNRYLRLTWERRCFDCWEEYGTRRHMTTWAAIAKGLQESGHQFGMSPSTDTSGEIVARLEYYATKSGLLLKFVPDPEVMDPTPHDIDPTGQAIAGHERIGRVLSPDAIDGSALLVLGGFGPFGSSSSIVPATLDAIESSLVVEGGVHRYLEDEYYGGGLWLVLAGALACAQASTDLLRAQATLRWIEDQADEAGNLGEQTASHLRKPESLEPWIQRWGLPANPLLWSHAMYLLGMAAIETNGVPPNR